MQNPSPAWLSRLWQTPTWGKLAFFRVYSGTLRSGSYVLNVSTGKRERVGRILLMHANHREDVDQVFSGEIAAIVGSEGYLHR